MNASVHYTDMPYLSQFPINPMKLTLTLFAALLLAPLARLSATDAPPSATKPNIVFIFADDWGWGDLSCHGHPWIKTPNLDRLAREGTDFQQFNVLNPVCSPSRTAVLTGMYPARFSVHQHFAAPAAESCAGHARLAGSQKRRRCRVFSKQLAIAPRISESGI